MIKTTIAVGLLASALFIAPQTQVFAQSSPPKAPISSGNQDDKEQVGNKNAATSSPSYNSAAPSMSDPKAPLSSGNQDDKEAIGNKKAATSPSPTAAAGSTCAQINDMTQRQDCLTKERTTGLNNTGNDSNKHVAPNDKDVAPAPVKR